MFKGGLVVAEEIPDGRKPHPAGSVIDGLPFVLVSHGPNGRNAVNHWATLQNRARGTFIPIFPEFSYPICNRASQSVDADPIYSNIPLSDRVQHFEMANAARRTLGGYAEFTDSGCFIGGGRFGDADVNYNPGSFVWQPPGIGDGGDFDDLLLWGTRGELSAWVPGNIPLLPPMVMAYFGPEFPPN